MEKPYTLEAIYVSANHLPPGQGNQCHAPALRKRCGLQSVRIEETSSAEHRKAGLDFAKTASQTVLPVHRFQSPVFLQHHSLFVQLISKESSHFNTWLRQWKKKGCRLLPLPALFFAVRWHSITIPTYREKLAHFLLENFVVNLQKDAEDDTIHL